MVWSAGLWVSTARSWGRLCLLVMTEYHKGSQLWMLIKSLALGKVLVVFFSFDFLLCYYFLVITPDTGQGFIFILKSQDLRVGRNGLSFIPPRICRQLGISWRPSRGSEHLLRVTIIELRVKEKACWAFILHKLLPRTTVPSLTWEIEFSDLRGYFCLVSCFIWP